MVRVRAAVAAWRDARATDAYVRQRAWHWAQHGSFALATDYLLRILNRHPRDPFALALGAVAARYTSQSTLHDKCVEAQRRVCAVKGVDDVTTLLPSRTQAAAAATTTTTDIATASGPAAEDVRAWLHDHATSSAVAAATSASSAAAVDGSNDNDDERRVEQLTVRESEALAETQQRVRAAAARVVVTSPPGCVAAAAASAASSVAPAVELLLPAGSVYGRGLYATRHVAARTALLYDAPALVQRCSDAYCAHCLTPMTFAATTTTNDTDGHADDMASSSSSFVLCPHCAHESYCSARCRDAAWRQYHACCCASRNPAYAAWQSSMWQTITEQQQQQLQQPLQQNDGSAIDNDGDARAAVMHDVRGAARAAVTCLAVGKLCAMATMQQQHPCALHALRHLRGVADYDACTALSEVGALAVTLASALRQPHLYLEEVLSLFALLQTNEVVRPGGLALYPVLSLLNHSCEPNCRLVPATHVRGLPHTRNNNDNDDDNNNNNNNNNNDDDRRSTAYVLAATRDVRSGEQLFVDYNAHLTSRLGYDDRKALCAQRHFECYCARCQEVATLSSWLSQLAHAVEALPDTARHTTQTQQQPSLRTQDSSTTTPLATTSFTQQQQQQQRVHALWDDVQRTAAQAHVMRETDTLCSIVFGLLRKGHTPSALDAWPALVEQLLTYSDVELTSVLHYPGVPDATLRRAARDDNDDDNDTRRSRTRRTTSWTAHGRYAAARRNHAAYHTLPSRETLLTTGGVVPLSARVPCADGQALGRLVHAYVDHVCDVLARLSSTTTTTTTTASDVTRVADAVRAMQAALLRVLRRNATTLRYDHVATALQRLLACCRHLDDLVVAHTRNSNNNNNNSNSNDDDDAASSLLVSLACALCTRELRTRALGARVLLRYLAGEYDGSNNRHYNDSCRARARALWPASASASSCTHARDVCNNSAAATNVATATTSDALDVRTEQRRLRLLHHCVYALYRDFQRNDNNNNDDDNDDDDDDVVPLLRVVYSELDVVLQRNANSGNALQLSSAAQEQLRASVSLTLLRALRRSLRRQPDAFLRAAMPLVDRCAASMAVEAELLAGKVALLDCLSLDAQGKQVLYTELVTSLRTLVELQQQQQQQSRAATTSAHVALPFVPYSSSHNNNSSSRDDTTTTTRSNDGDQHSDSDDEDAVWWASDDRPPSNNLHNSRASDDDDSNNSSSRGSDDDDDDRHVLASLSRRVLQDAHVRVLRALCASHDRDRIDDAYHLVVTHKYHGLRVTRDVVQPLLAVLSRRGDGRVFNLVDVCVLYSNSVLDMQTIAYLFDACAVAGDHYRARELLQLLREVLPGFVVRAPASLRATLRELRLLPAPPPHLFRSTEEALVSAALDGGDVDADSVTDLVAAAAAASVVGDN